MAKGKKPRPPSAATGTAASSSAASGAARPAVVPAVVPAKPAKPAAPAATDAADLEAALEQGAGIGAGGSGGPRDEFDTNADILPAARKKGPSEAPQEVEKPMSKRKKRKLEQLAQKRASQEMRAEVLKGLKAVQLSAEQAALMRASQSQRISKRDQEDMAKRRLAMGVPLTEEQQRLQQKPPPRKAPVEEEKPVKLVAAAQPPKVKAETPAAQAAKAAAAFAASASATPQEVAAKAAAAAAAKAKAKAKAEAAKADAAKAEPEELVASAQRLTPERVERSAAIDEQRSKLPAVMMEQEAVEMTLGSDVMLVCGDTGCGKSTQVPQFLYEAGFCDGGRYLIGVTQPRRVAAVSVSQRVGQELGSPETVGYQVRYDHSMCTKDMRIKFMTDGILLREVQADFLCRKYSAIIIDEAHERGVNCDILIGLLSRAVQRRRKDFEEAVAKGLYKPGKGAPEGSEKSEVPPPLRLIIMSATLRLCDFTENRQLFPSPPPVLRIDARTFPVTVHFSRSTDDDYIKAAHKMVRKIHKQLPPGTILIFVTGKHEVHRLCRLIQQSNRRLRAGASADEDQQEDGEEEEEEQQNGNELLEASDDEFGGASEDDVEGSAEMADGSAAREPVAKAGKGGKKKRKRAAEGEGQAQEATASGAARANAADEQAAPAAGRRKKRRKKAEGADACEEPNGVEKAEGEQPAAGPAAEASAAALAKAVAEGGSGKKKKKRRKSQESAGGTGAEGDAAAAGEKGEAGAEEEPECDVSYKLDEEEDVVVLDPESTVGAEDSKDSEAKKEKRIRMSKLDRSRTAGGVFQGIGFGEGPLHVLPLYAQLPARAQLAPFGPCPEGKRVVVVSTNVAETSVTLPNVRYVVDTGQEKRRKYRAASGISSFVIDKISKASADQRAGRAGRLGPGHTYRLYSSAAFENHFMQFAPIPMLHTPMDPVLLLLAFLGVPRLDVFPWPTPPGTDAVTAAIRRLRALGAIKDDGKPLDGGQQSAEKAAAAAVRCTQLGYRLAALPVAPRYAKVLLAAVTESQDMEGGGIVGHACGLVAALSVGNLTCWESVPGEEEVGGSSGSSGGLENELLRGQREAQKLLRQAQEKEAPQWSQLRDDMDGLLWLMGGYSWAIAGGEEAAEQFCEANRVNARQISEAHSLMQQLATLLQRRLQLEEEGLEMELPLRLMPPSPAQALKLRECLVDGLLDRVAVVNTDLGRGAYTCSDVGRDAPVFVHNSSNVYRHRPRPSVLVFNEIISSSRPFMRDCVGVDPVLLARRAATGECPLLRLGDFLAVPAPRYLKDQDKVLAFASPSYSPLDYSLPTVEVPVPADSIFRYKVFAKALMEGEVIPGFPQHAAQLLARPSLILHAPTNPRVSGIVGPLWEQKVGSRAELQQRWAVDDRFLLEGYLKWLPASVHPDVRIAWPPSSSKRKG